MILLLGVSVLQVVDLGRVSFLNLLQIGLFGSSVQITFSRACTGATAFIVNGRVINRTVRLWCDVVIPNHISIN